MKDNTVATLNTLAGNAADSVELSSGAAVGVYVCSGRVLPKILNLVGRVSTDLGLTLQDQDGIKDKLLAKVSDIGFILQLIANYSDDVYALLALLTSIKSEDEIIDLPLDDIATLTTKVIEVNSAFFTKRVLPAIQRGGATLQA